MSTPAPSISERYDDDGNHTITVVTTPAFITEMSPADYSTYQQSMAALVDIFKRANAPCDHPTGSLSVNGSAQVLCATCGQKWVVQV